MSSFFSNASLINNLLKKFSDQLGQKIDFPRRYHVLREKSLKI